MQERVLGPQADREVRTAVIPLDPVEPEPEPEPEEVPVGKAYYVELPREVYAAANAALPAVCRFSQPGLGINNFWFYDAEGKVVVFGPAPVQRRKG